MIIVVQQMQQVNRTHAVVFMQDCTWFLTFRKELIFGLEILIIFFSQLFFKSLRLTFNNDI